MIQHHAEGMKKKTVSSGAFFEELQNVLHERRMAHVGFTAVAADRNEIGALAHVIRGRQTGIFSDGGALRVYTMVSNIERKER